MPSTATPSPVYISLQAAAARVGFSVHALRKLIASGELAGYRISQKPGASIRVKASDVDALMQPVIPAAITAAR